MNRIILFESMSFKAEPQGRIIFAPGVYALDDRYLTQAYAEAAIAADKACDADGDEVFMYEARGAIAVIEQRALTRAAEELAAEQAANPPAPAAEAPSVPVVANTPLPGGPVQTPPPQNVDVAAPASVEPSVTPGAE